jgi:GDPmannose 4,6-dehydratase
MASETDATNIAKSWSTHVTGFENLLNALEDCGESVQIALASSCLIYAPSDHPIDENASLQPDSVYGVTKAAAVLLAREHRRQGVSVFTAVLFPHESGLRKETFVASKIVRAGLRIAAGSDERLVLSDLESAVDWSMAHDVVRCLVELVRNGAPDDYVFASGRASTIRELVESVSRQLRIPLLDRVDVQRAKLLRPHVRRFGDPSRLISATSWRPDSNIDAFVERLIESHRMHL